jgi:hypothetical protein
VANIELRNHEAINPNRPRGKAILIQNKRHTASSSRA